jgi:hypothetical protein
MKKAATPFLCGHITLVGCGYTVCKAVATVHTSKPRPSYALDLRSMTMAKANRIMTEHRCAKHASDLK